VNKEISPNLSLSDLPASYETDDDLRYLSISGKSELQVFHERLGGITSRLGSSL